MNTGILKHLVYEKLLVPLGNSRRIKRLLVRVPLQFNNTVCYRRSYYPLLVIHSSARKMVFVTKYARVDQAKFVEFCLSRVE